MAGKIKKIKIIPSKIKVIESKSLESKMELSETKNFTEFISENGGKSVREIAPVINNGQFQVKEESSLEKQRTSRTTEEESPISYESLARANKPLSQRQTRYVATMQDVDVISRREELVSSPGQKNQLGFENQELSRLSSRPDSRKYYEDKIEAKEEEIKRKLPFE